MAGDATGPEMGKAGWAFASGARGWQLIPLSVGAGGGGGGAMVGPLGFVAHLVVAAAHGRTGLARSGVGLHACACRRRRARVLVGRRGPSRSGSFFAPVRDPGGHRQAVMRRAGLRLG